MKTLAYAVLLGAALHSHAEDGSFVQYDRTGHGNAVVAVRSVGDQQFSGAYSQWSDTGRSYGLSATQRVHQSSGEHSTFQARMGLTAMSHRSDTGNGDAVGVKVAAEQFAQGGWGTAYALAEVSTAFKSWLGVLQYTPPGSQLGVEWSAVGDDRWYVGHRLALRYAFQGTPWSLRIGRQLNDDKMFIGVAYNTF